ncbi:hypothetical protein GCM10009737_33630 [Nocardioides lentus]|uniref:LytR/CpsA/Psr regulator C-terminal domain-containing protein n=1 Tax=Nocardioides lentus TaxID=338077 RepID=A0ABN2PTN1_9ACTN
MSRRLRAAITLLVLTVVLLAGGAWAWSALFSPLPESVFGGGEEEAVCTDREVEAGSRLTPDGVTVSVVNAGDRQGAAGQTLERLVDAGFAEGVEDNAPDDADVRRVQIWTDDPSSPAVRLVASYLGDPRIEQREVDVPGVYVVVGDEFDELSEGRPRIRVPDDTTVCGPAGA